MLLQYQCLLNCQKSQRNRTDSFHCVPSWTYWTSAVWPSRARRWCTSYRSHRAGSCSGDRDSRTIPPCRSDFHHSLETKCDRKLRTWFKVCSQGSITTANFYRPPSEGWRKVIFSVCPHFGGGGSQVPVSDLGRGLPGLRFSGGGSQVSDFLGGSQVSDFRARGVPGLRFSGGGGTQSQ